MKEKKLKENKIITITAIINFIVAVLKITFGVLFSFSTLISDSIQSFIDFFTDIMSIVANKIGKRRANKTYPFGYGQVYYIANLITGFLLFLIGIFILYQFFFFNGTFTPSIKITIALLVVLLLKSIVVYLLNHYGRKYTSELMIESAKESKADFISTVVVLGVLLIAFFEEHIPDGINIDKIGSFGMALYVFYTSIKMMVLNVKGLLANDTENEELKQQIEQKLQKYEDVKLKKVKIIKMSSYYSVFLQIKTSDEMTIKEYIAYEKKIKSKLKSYNKLIRFVDVHPL